MTREELEMVYKNTRVEAIRVLEAMGFGWCAEDAVHAAALYFLTRQRGALTPSLFIEYAVKRARHMRENWNENHIHLEELWEPAWEE